MKIKTSSEENDNRGEKPGKPQEEGGPHQFLLQKKNPPLEKTVEPPPKGAPREQLEGERLTETQLNPICVFSLFLSFGITIASERYPGGKRRSSLHTGATKVECLTNQNDIEEMLQVLKKNNKNEGNKTVTTRQDSEWVTNRHENRPMQGRQSRKRPYNDSRPPPEPRRIPPPTIG